MDDKEVAEKLIAYLDVLELSNDEIIKRMDFIINGRTLTYEEAEDFIEFVRAKRNERPKH